MSAQPDYPPAGHNLPDKNLRAIRKALVVPQDREAFDAGLEESLAEVRRSLDLSELNDFVHTWWLIACDSVKDPKGRTKMYEHAARVAERAASGLPAARGTKSFKELLAERGVNVES